MGKMLIIFARGIIEFLLGFAMLVVAVWLRKNSLLYLNDALNVIILGCLVMSGVLFMADSMCPLLKGGEFFGELFMEKIEKLKPILWRYWLEIILGFSVMLVMVYEIIFWLGSNEIFFSARYMNPIAFTLMIVFLAQFLRVLRENNGLPFLGIVMIILGSGLIMGGKFVPFVKYGMPVALYVLLSITFIGFGTAVAVISSLENSEGF
ncbi:MAG: hypothetical protein OQK82_06435 [Candidatus Pacearchaeota archaeon]|nr:hypothetical protein [Candidatus Pacearchaeota archaeon]